MTDSPGKDTKRAGNIDHVGRLIHYAGAREELGSERMDSARERVATHWEKVVVAHKGDHSGRRLRLTSIAASIVIVAVTSLLVSQMNFSPQSIRAASIERVIGSVSIGSGAAAHGGKIEAGTIIETGSESRIALRMASGKSLRIDTSSRLLVHSSANVSLQAGAVYVDTSGVSDPQPILISTPVGTAQDIGTQFQVRLAGSSLIVGVRDGVVEIAQSDGHSLAVNEGHSVELGAAGRKTERALLINDPSWDWVETVVPVFDIQDTTLERYLVWYAQEKGFSLQWEDTVSESNARAILLSGSIADTSLSEGLQIVRQIAHFDIRIDGDSIWVKVE